MNLKNVFVHLRLLVVLLLASVFHLFAVSGGNF